MKDGKLSLFPRMLMFSIAFFLVGCETASLTPTPTPTKDAISLVSTIVATSTIPTPKSLPATQSPPATPSLVPTSSNTPTRIPPVEPTATRRPSAIATPPGTDPIEQVLWLYETNNGCQLPCWWGIVPGQTTWETAERFFNSFVSDIYSAPSPQLTNYSPHILLPSQVFNVSFTHPTYTVREGIVDSILTSVSIGDTPDGYLIQYDLSSLLASYGQPTEVWLFTYPAPFEHNDLPFIVVLFYPQQGITALYSDNGVRQGDIVQGCPQVDPVDILSLRLPDLTLTFEDEIRGTSALERDYLSLEEATGMDVATFYQTFQNPDNTTCLETPTDLWY